jgi:hypothetical protein
MFLARKRTILGLLAAPLATGVVVAFAVIARRIGDGMPPLTSGYEVIPMIIIASMVAYPAVAIAMPVLYVFERLHIHGWLWYGIAGALLGFAYYLLLSGNDVPLATERDVSDAIWWTVSGVASALLFRSIHGSADSRIPN